MIRRAFLRRMAAGALAASLLREALLHGAPAIESEPEAEVIGWEWQVFSESFYAGIVSARDDSYLPRPAGPTYVSHFVPVYADGSRGEPLD